MASPKKAKQGLVERLKQWCSVSICYCSSINKTKSPDPGDIPSPNIQRSESHDSHMTDQSERGLSRASSLARTNSKSVTWQSSTRSSEEGAATSLPASLLSGSSRRLSKLLSQSIDSQIEELPPELRSLEARMTALFGNNFFRTVDEDEEESEYDQDWRAMEIKLQLSEQQLQAKISEVKEMVANIETSAQDKFTKGGFMPLGFEVSNVRSLRQRKASFRSPPMYTHPGGYRFLVEVSPGGEGMAECTHLSINIISLKGDYDGLLEFPVTFVLTIRIMNSYSEHSGHFTRELECMYEKPVPSMEIGGEFEFILLNRLYWNEKKQTIYLDNDKIKFQIIRVLFSDPQ